MRLLLLAFILPLFCVAAEIPPGSHVLLKMINSVTTRTAKEGDYVYMQTATPIVSGGQVVVPESTYVQGVVSHCRESGRVKGRAELGIRIEKMTFASGKVIQVNPNLSSVDAGGTSQKVDKEQEIKQGIDVGPRGWQPSLAPAPPSAAGPIIVGAAQASALAWAAVSVSRL
jgi:hypothetical protein